MAGDQKRGNFFKWVILNNFDISDFLNEIQEPLFLFDSDEIIFWNRYSKENFSNLPEDYKSWIQQEELLAQLAKFFESGEVPESRWFKSLQTQEGHLQRFEWSFTNLPSTYTSRFLIAKANPIRYFGANTEENFFAG